MQDVAMEGVRTAPPKIEAPRQREAQANMSGATEMGVVTETDPIANIYQEEPTKTSEMNELMKIISAQGKSASPQEAVKQVTNNIPQEAKKQGFFAQIWEAIKNFFGNLFK